MTLLGRDGNKKLQERIDQKYIDYEKVFSRIDIRR